MLNKLVLVLSVSIVSLYASESVESANDKASALSKLISHKEMKLINDVFVTLDVSSALAIVDTRFVIDDFKNAPKRIHCDKSLVTLSYKF